jgi:hypothetical protein
VSVERIAQTDQSHSNIIHVHLCGRSEDNFFCSRAKISSKPEMTGLVADWWTPQSIGRIEQHHNFAGVPGFLLALFTSIQNARSAISVV